MNCMNCGNAMRPDVKFCPQCGTPVPQPAPYTPPPAGQVRTSWAAAPAAAPPPRRKSRAGKILLIVFGVFLLLAGGAAAAVYFGVRYFADSVKTSEPYRVAEKQLRESPAAAEALGEIKSTGFPLGTFNTQAGGSGNAAFTMSVEGTKASGQYVAVLTRQSGEWRVTSGILRLSGGEVVVLVGEGEGGAATPDPAADVDGADGPPPPPAPPGYGRPGALSVPGAVKGGALDDKATSKPDPAYPRIAQAAKARGTVVVEVAVDERGRVMQARAVSGHPLLRAAAEAAARQAEFEPALSGGKPAKVVGTLTYEFE